MAVASPIVINSSSPHALTLPSVTPPSARKYSDEIVSSSPRLPSPSIFRRPHVPTLKSGSRAVEIPSGANAGFASAARLWRENGLGEGLEGDKETAKVGPDVEKGQEAQVPNKKARRSAGKLVRPTKSLTKPVKKDSTIGRRTSTDLETYAYEGALPENVRSAEGDSHLKVYDGAAEHANRLPPAASKPEAALSEYAFHVPDDQKRLETAEEATKPAAKSRKKTTKTLLTDAAAPKKKQSRKRKKKSESIILNSDDSIADAKAASANPEPRKPHSGVKDQPVEKSTPTPKVGKATINLKDFTLQPSPRSVDVENLSAAAKFLGKANAATVETAEKSAYFDNPPASQAVNAESVDVGTRLELPYVVEAAPEDNVSNGAVPAAKTTSRRRLSWTPAKDTTSKDAIAFPSPTARSISSVGSAPKVQLADVLGNFGYVGGGDSATFATERTRTGEAVTKRRRIGLADAAAIRIMNRPTADAGLATNTKEPKTVKRSKAPKKKARTITALATAAFQPVVEVDAGQDTVSEFFEHNKTQPAIDPVQTKQEKATTSKAKPKRPRKPRAKSTTADGQAATGNSKKTTKSKKSKAKFNEANYLPPLHSPTRASAHLAKQGFLFGTSSQLAIEESPSFIRDMQVAIRESESVGIHAAEMASQLPSSQTTVSPQKKSSMKVPIAPHGTCLSLEQADRELWCSAARDGIGRVFIPSNGRETDEVLPSEQSCALEESLVGEANADEVVVDLCDTLPAAPVVEPSAAGTIPNVQGAGELNLDSAAEAPKHTLDVLEVKSQDDDSNSWIVLRSDDSDILPMRPCPMREPPVASTSTTAPILHPEVQRYHSLSPSRPALYPLDPNSKVPVYISLDKGRAAAPVRPLSSSAVDLARTRPTAAAHLSERHTQNVDLRATSVASSPRKRGRPRKEDSNIHAATAIVAKTKKAKVATPASQPTAQREWLNIDEISDSDAPNTPSPPRRRASSSPPVVQPLRLSPSGSPSKVAKTNGSRTMNIKPDDSSWQSMRGPVFERITEVVKSNPHNTNPNNPTWWQKILLYDPIVLEDFTSWLNEQGIRVQWQRSKPTRWKRKAGQHKESEEPGRGDNLEELDYEIAEDPLQPWMVQKWCEEKSVCCVWKDGVRARIRSRY